jgi:hypothetical protein
MLKYSKDWIGLAQDRDSWRELVKVIMNRRVPYNAESYWVAAQVVASQVVLNSIDLISVVFA